MDKEKLKSLSTWITKLPKNDFHMGCEECSPLSHIIKMSEKQVKAGFLSISSNFKFKGHVIWVNYIKYLYGITDNQFQFIFSAIFIHDNTQESFAKRIEYLLRGGSLPDEWWNLVRAKDFFYNK